MTYSDIMKKYDGFFVIASVEERDESGKAVKFTVLDKSMNKGEAIKLYKGYSKISKNVVLIPVFNNREITIALVTEGTTVVEPLMSSEEDARFLRTYLTAQD